MVDLLLLLRLGHLVVLLHQLVLDLLVVLVVVHQIVMTEQQMLVALVIVHRHGSGGVWIHQVALHLVAQQSCHFSRGGVNWHHAVRLCTRIERRLFALVSLCPRHVQHSTGKSHRRSSSLSARKRK